MAHEPDPAFELWWADILQTIPLLKEYMSEEHEDVRQILKSVAEQAWCAAGIDLTETANQSIEKVSKIGVDAVETLQARNGELQAHIDTIIVAIHLTYHVTNPGHWTECETVICGTTADVLLKKKERKSGRD